MYVLRGLLRASKKIIPPIRNLTRDLLSNNQFKFQTEVQKPCIKTVLTCQGTTATTTITLETIKSETEYPEAKIIGNIKQVTSKINHGAKKAAKSIKKPEKTIKLKGTKGNSESITTTANNKVTQSIKNPSQRVQEQHEHSEKIQQAVVQSPAGADTKYPNQVPTPAFIHKYVKKRSSNTRTQPLLRQITTNHQRETIHPPTVQLSSCRIIKKVIPKHRSEKRLIRQSGATRTGHIRIRRNRIVRTIGKIPAAITTTTNH